MSSKSLFVNASFAAALSICAGSSLRAADVTQPKSIVDEGDTKLLHSPIVISTVFPLVDRFLWGSGGMWGHGKYPDPAIYSDIYEYRCDGVQIKKLTMRGAPDGDNLTVQVEGKVRGKHASHDKKYTFDCSSLMANQSWPTQKAKITRWNLKTTPASSFTSRSRRRY